MVAPCSILKQVLAELCPKCYANNTTKRAVAILKAALRLQRLLPF